MKRFVLLSLLVFVMSVPAVSAQQAAKPTEETRPAEPEPFTVDLKLNVNADTQFYRLAGAMQVENNATNSWSLDTLGFRDVRVVIFMTETKKEGSKVSSSSLDVRMGLRDGNDELETNDQEIPISIGKTSGRAFIAPVYGPNTKITVTTKNVSGKLYVLAYAVK